jgi:hypothetical protein
MPAEHSYTLLDSGVWSHQTVNACGGHDDTQSVSYRHSRYPDHRLKGVANDLALLAHALQHQQYPVPSIHIFENTHTTRAALHDLFSEIRTHYNNTEQGSCSIHISARAMFSPASMPGGVRPSDGDLSDFSTAFSFATLNHYLPLHPGIRVTTTIDT